jgi:RNA-binding protein
MTLPSLTGAEKTRLRGLGQTMADGAWLGKDGVSPAFLAELNRQFATHELVKLRFTGGQDRHERAALTATVEQAAPCLCVGAVGHTALLWRPHAEPVPVATEA